VRYNCKFAIGPPVLPSTGKEYAKAEVLERWGFKGYRVQSKTPLGTFLALVQGIMIVQKENELSLPWI
jgi:hypothetical protein